MKTRNQRITFSDISSVKYWYTKTQSGLRKRLFTRRNEI